MTKCRPVVWMLPAALLAVSLAAVTGPRQSGAPPQARDERVKQFLESHRTQWRDMNVPEADGRLLYELILKSGYRQALEIGSSTGHSGVWIAWALSKTGGRLTTIEIDEGRYRTAVANYREAGLADLIDARLGDAHSIVPQLEGPFDFVFCDADKEWYKNYLEAVLPKLTAGGCFAAHNVSQSRRGWTGEFLDFARSRPELETTVDPTSYSGMATIRKKAGK